MDRTTRWTRLILGLAFLIPTLSYVVECCFGTAIDDPSIFRYIGRTVANGGVMYQIAWDNKGPMLFLPNVLGYLIPGLGDHGPGLVFLLMSFVSIWFFFKIARCFVSGFVSACYSVVFAAMCVGNRSGAYLDCQEMAALFFILPGAYCAINDRYWWHDLILGICVGCVFLIKANLISFGGAALLLWLYEVCTTKDWPLLLRRAIWSFVGFVGLLGVVTMCFAFWDAAYDMWDATLLFGLFEYCKSDVPWFDWWRAYLSRNVFSGGWVLDHYFLGLPFAFGGLWCLIREKAYFSKALYFSSWLILDLIFTFAFKTFYPHYLIVSYAEICILLAIATQYARGRSIRILFIAWGVVTCLFFGARCRNVHHCVARQRASVDECVRFFKENYKGGEVFVDGFFLISDVLNELKITTPQKYYNLSMNYRFAGEKRRMEIKEEFERLILNAPTNSCFIFDRHVEDDFRKWFPCAFKRNMEMHSLPNGFTIGVLK